MRIKRLKLSGFKSFVEPAELRIEPGLTGVVGPNGCGKSNLLEAIRWVMGESSAKSMRGGGMDDVIFAGTARLPPRDFAEVVLLAEDSARRELEVVRRIERGAGSAYRVNGRDARARDVALVFADAATGAHSPALVSQGRIAAVIAAKPAERRAMLEEAAGISGLHVRRKDAEQKLRATEANLARLETLMAGLDARIGALRRQARAAQRYRALSETIRLAEARLAFARWRDAAASADAARAEAADAERRVGEEQAATRAAQAAQTTAAAALAKARDTLADRRDDASAHGHRMASLTGQLEAAEERLKDLERQAQRLEQDRGDADRLTRDAADALARLERELVTSEAGLAAEAERRPALSSALDDAERAGRAAELAMAEATAAQAGVEAEWRIAEAEVCAARGRQAQLDVEAHRHAAQRAALDQAGDPEAALGRATTRRDLAARALADARARLNGEQARKVELQAERDSASSTLAAAKAEFAGIEREHAALLRDRQARERQAKGGHGLPIAIDRLRAASGYERALAAVLGRDARSALGAAPENAEGRFWTGADPPAPVADSLLHHVPECPPELAARLALVRVADADVGRVLAPGEWLVTRKGRLRRWDGFVAAGEGAAEAARLAAENRFAELDAELPGARAELAEAESARERAQAELSTLQIALVSAERAVGAAAEEERAALRALDQAEDARTRHAARSAELEVVAGELAERRRLATEEASAAEHRRAALADPAAGRVALAAARGRHDGARQAVQSASAALAAHEQALAVSR
ncbi:MAG: AAA family ATPase, partial [Novosphingobium sp.]